MKDEVVSGGVVWRCVVLVLCSASRVLLTIVYRCLPTSPTHVDVATPHATRYLYSLPLSLLCTAPFLSTPAFRVQKRTPGKLPSISRRIGPY